MKPPTTGTRIEIHGTKEFTFFSRLGGGSQVFNSDWSLTKEQRAGSHREHRAYR
jgi:hypothetical protein